MSIAGKLDHWKAEGLIDAPTVERILEWEHARRRPVLAYILGGLGALTVAVGLVSVVAANWEALGRFAKLGLDLALLGGLSFGVARVQGRWAREVLVILYFGATLGSIGLVSQVYQLGGEVYSALLLWMVLATPVAIMGRTWLLAAAWLAGACTTIGVSVAELLDRWSPDDSIAIAVALGSALFVVGALIVAGGSRALVARRPQFAALFRVVGWSALAVLASVAQMIWYADVDDDLLASVPLVLLLGVVVAWRLPAQLERPTPRTVWTARGAVVLAALLSAAAMLPHDEIRALAALGFLLLWLGFAFGVHQLGRIGLLNLATAVLALRVLIAYVELFGSLMQTGLAMILGGLLTIGLAWGWRRVGRLARDEMQGRSQS
jgi:uncharacterized membrane protein